MSEKQKKAGFLLPDPIAGYDLWCVRLKVPSAPEYRAAFRGALRILEQWWGWEKTGDTRASQAATYWREIIYNHLQVGGCEFVDDVRQRPGAACKLDKLVDGAWIEFADLQKCPPKIRMNNGRLEVSTDGGQTWQTIEGDPGGGGGQPGVQPGGAEPLAPGECRELDITVYANAPALFPMRVLPGYSVTFISYTGAWKHDNLLTTVWSCAPGDQFFLGACTSPIAQLGDYLTDQPVSRLIARYGALYFDAFERYTLPAGDEDYLELMMNDSDRANNAGSVNVKVRVCNPGWCHEFDFTVSQHGWTIVLGTYQAGQGFTDQQPSTDNVNLTYAWTTPAHITQVQFVFNQIWTGQNPRNLVRQTESGADEGQSSEQGANTVLVDVDYTGNSIFTATDRRVGFNQAMDNLRLTKIRLYGTGDNPFGSNNCT